MVKNKTFLTVGVAVILAFFIVGTAFADKQAKIVYDAEYQKLLKQHSAEWSAEDKALEKRLAELEAKHGKKPNIIYFMWDDAAYGRVGHPMLSKLTGIHTPNIDTMAQEGMTLTRMYTEPSCTPSRAAVMTAST